MIIEYNIKYTLKDNKQRVEILYYFGGKIEHPYLISHINLGFMFDFTWPLFYQWCKVIQFGGIYFGSTQTGAEILSYIEVYN